MGLVLGLDAADALRAHLFGGPDHVSEPRHVALASTSNSEDAAWLAVADVAGVATDLGIDYRLIGGNSVALLVQVHDAATQVPGRATADADMGASFEVCADPRLVPALTALGYDRHVRAALVMKAHAYAGRLSDNDALDIWRLLQSASNAGDTAADWPTRSTARDAAVILHSTSPHQEAADHVGPHRTAPTRRGSAH